MSCFKGVNDKPPTSARNLASPNCQGIPAKVNLIPLIRGPAPPYVNVPMMDTIEDFAPRLKKAGSRCLLRKTRGEGYYAGLRPS